MTPVANPVADPRSTDGCRLRALVRLARPGQWPKNVLVVCIPLLDPLSWRATALANLLARRIGRLSEDELAAIDGILRASDRA